MMRIGVDRRWCVRLWAQVPLPLPAAHVWEQAGDFARFTTLDPFHGRLTLHGPPAAGTTLEIEHAFLGWRLRRAGRILRWDAGRGYAFSDLSIRGPRVGFPHIYEYRVLPVGAAASLLLVRVRGRWTARWLPRWAVRLWLGWVMLGAVRILESHLLGPAAWSGLSGAGRLEAAFAETPKRSTGTPSVPQPPPAPRAELGASGKS